MSIPFENMREAFNANSATTEHETEFERLLNESTEIRRMIEVLMDDAYEPEDRERIKGLFNGANSEPPIDVLDAIEAGDHVDRIEALLGKEKLSASEISLLRDLVAPTDDEKLLVKPEILVDELGAEKLGRYFSLFEGRGMKNPYYFPLPVVDGEIGNYLQFEMNRHEKGHQAGFVQRVLQYPYSEKLNLNEQIDLNMGLNLMISFLRSNPAYHARLFEVVTAEELTCFFKTLDVYAPLSVRKVIHYLFSPDRMKLTKGVLMHTRKESRFESPKKKILTRRDAKFFNRK